MWLLQIEQYKEEIKRLQESESEIKALSVNYAALLKEKEAILCPVAGFLCCFVFSVDSYALVAEGFIVGQQGLLDKSGSERLKIVLVVT